MRVGLIGAGNMASALARGWGDPVLCTDAIAARAAALAAELGGEVAASNAELAQQADVVVLCHKPDQLAAVAEEVAPHAQAVVSILGGVGLEALRGAYPGVPVIRLMPNVAVEVRQGVICIAAAPDVPAALASEVVALLERVATVAHVPEPLMEVATAVMGVGPAYVSLFVEAQVDAAVRLGMPPELAAQLATATAAGTAALLAARDYDTLGVRRAVTSPGGSTARGLAALEQGGLRSSFQAAAEAVVHGGGR
ncbi:MAG TPA: pyrroline-5-carboxylate reductase dimerization domain-containing protein [Conexibacter sp.]|nr:pyrroline-5-carboxylate reductase dimerization domain-containing protein [Conexibacter sp.]